jgi:hypothetical protein
MQVQYVLHLLPCTHQDDYLTSCQTFCNKGWSIFAIAARTLSLKLFSCGKQTSSSTKPHRKKSWGVRSGDRGGQEVGHPRPVHCSNNCLFKNVITSLRMCGGVPSWLKTTFSLSWSSWDVKHTFNMSRQISRHLTFVVYSSGKSWNYFLHTLAKKI